MNKNQYPKGLNSLVELSFLISGKTLDTNLSRNSLSNVLEVEPETINQLDIK